MEALVPSLSYHCRMFVVVALAVLMTSVAASPALVSPFEPIDIFQRAGSGCSTSGPSSCYNTTSVKDTCCFESPGGLLLQTQFWDTNPAVSISVFCFFYFQFVFDQLTYIIVPFFRLVPATVGRYMACGLIIVIKPTRSFPYPARMPS